MSLSPNIIPILYLERSDFDNDLNLKQLHGKSIVIMFTSKGCGFCKKSYPEYIKFSKNNKNIIVCAVEATDDDDLPNDLAKKYNFQLLGFPMWIGVKNNKMTKQHRGDRTVEKFEELI